MKVKSLISDISTMILKRFTPYALLFTVFMFFTLLFTLYALPPSAVAADNLVVKDSGGTTKFVVKEDGKAGIMTANPVGGLQTGGIRC